MSRKVVGLNPGAGKSKISVQVLVLVGSSELHMLSMYEMSRGFIVSCAKVEDLFCI